MIRRPHAAAPLLLCAALLAGASPAAAQGKDDPAWVYFNAGQQAYAAGKYTYAIQAFEQAYKIAAKPGLVFSIAQAYRKQYVTNKSPRDLRKAVEHYRKYLELVPEGGRRPDAVEALEALEPAFARVSEEPAAAPAPAEEAVMPTRLMVSSSVRDARVVVDGGAPAEMPLMAEVKPGKHSVRITADGFFPEEREVVAAEGGIVALDVALREMPAQLIVTSISGASVAVDGRPVGTIPLGRPVELPAGSRFVTVTLNGYEGYSQDVTLKRGEKREIIVPLERTTQRVVSYVLMGAGLVTGGLGVLAALGAGGSQEEAEQINAQRALGSITPEQLTEYKDLVRDRNELRAAAGVAFGAAAAFAGTGLLLFFFDQPTVTPPPPRTDSGPSAPASPESKDKLMGFRAAPVLGPGIYGVTLGGRF